MTDQEARDETRDAVAKAMCAIEVRSKAASLEEVQAGIPRWTRHRYEAERLIDELADYGVHVSKHPEPEIADEMVDRFRVAWLGYPVDRGIGAFERRARAALEAALTPVGERE